MPQPVIAAGARTPVGKLLGALSTLSAPELGGHAIRAALDRAGVSPQQVDAVIFGNVVQAGVGPNPARLAGDLLANAESPPRHEAWLVRAMPGLNVGF